MNECLNMFLVLKYTNLFTNEYILKKIFYIFEYIQIFVPHWAVPIPRILPCRREGRRQLSTKLSEEPGKADIERKIFSQKCSCKLLEETIYMGAHSVQCEKKSFNLKQACFAGCTQILPDATPLIGKIHPFSKMAVNVGPMVAF